MKRSYHFRGKWGFDFTIFQIFPIDVPEETMMLDCFLSTMFSHTAKSLLYILVQKLVRDKIRSHHAIGLALLKVS